MRGEGHRNTRSLFLGCMSASWQHLHIKLLHWGLTSGPWNLCWVHVHLDVALFQAIRKKKWQNLTRAELDPSILLCSKTLNVTERGKKWSLCGNGWHHLHLDTEMGKPSELKLPYKASVSRRRADQKCTFWPTFPFVSPLGSLFPAFCAFFLKPSLFSAFTYTGTPVHRNKRLLSSTILAVRLLLSQK